jgi:hypothetical protein
VTAVLVDTRIAHALESDREVLTGDAWFPDHGIRLAGVGP